MPISWQYPYLSIKIHYLRKFVSGLISFNDQVFVYNMWKSLEQQCASCARIQPHLPPPEKPQSHSTPFFLHLKSTFLHLKSTSLHLTSTSLHPEKRDDRYLYYYTLAATFSRKGNWQNDSLLLFIINMF